jgi:hypothetical protein
VPKPQPDPGTSYASNQRRAAHTDATFVDNWTEMLPDRRVTFRLLAPKANAVSVLIGLKSGIYGASGTTTTAMTKGANGLWTGPNRRPSVDSRDA